MNLKVTLAALVAAFGLSLMAAGPAPAAPQTGYIPDTGITIQEMTTFLQANSVKAEIKGEGANRYILGEASGARFVVVMVDCNNGPRCASLTFDAAWDVTTVTLARLNEWNRDRRYLKAYLDTENKVHVQLNVNTGPKRTYEGLVDELGVWLSSLAEFSTFVSAAP